MSGERALPAPPFAVVHQLPGWELLWARLELRSSGAAGPDLAALRAQAARVARERFPAGELASHAVISELRRLFREAGTDPTRYRPSSEALLRRLLKGDELPTISPLVDLNNCLSARLGVPCCVMEERALEAPYALRAGAPGEEYESLKGPFRLEGRPLLVDARGPCDAPITGSERVKVTADTASAWLVAYLPAAAIRAETVAAELRALLAAAPIAECTLVAASR
jgi:DNA/RNA-binding domain of Phe-tRNA-synthetase-like protein